MRGDLPLTVTVDDRPREAQSIFNWAGGGRVLTISTVLPERGLAAELISTYVGHLETRTVATHLMLGPVGHPATIATVEHDEIGPIETVRECAYDHARQLIEALRATGRPASVTLDEQSFSELERVE